MARDGRTRLRANTGDLDKSGPELSDAAPIDQLRDEYRAVFDYTVAFPEFHRFMRQEAMYDNPRLRWVAETVLAPLIYRLLPKSEQHRGTAISPQSNRSCFTI